MATIKSYTDLEQSKKLAEILPLESADMCYIKHASSDNPNYEFNEDFPPMILGNVPINEITAETLPCWSLAALLSVLPEGTRLLKSANISSANDIKYHCDCPKSNIDKWFDNPVDACYEMILKLHELKML